MRSRDFTFPFARCVVLVVLAAAAGFTARAAPVTPTIEYGVKAGFLYNFTKFVAWPETAFATPQEAFVLGVLDREGTAGTLITEAFRLKTTSTGRPITVRVFTQPGPDLATCNLVFFARPTESDLAAVRVLVAGRAVLLVGESDGFAQTGGTINLVVAGDTIRCEVNLRRAEQAGLALSGRLAGISRLVRDTETALP